MAPLSNYGYNVPEHEHFGDENNITAANIVVVNPSVEERPDGKYILVFKGWQNKKGFGPVHGVAVSGSPTGPFEVLPEPIMIVEQAGGEIAMAEDPFIWFNKSRNSFYALVRDFNGDITGRGHSMALFKSPDGIQWLPAENVLASDLRVRWEDGTKSQVARLERPQLLLDEDGEPQVLFAACAIESPSKKNGHSFNVHIPLKNRDNRVSIDLNKKRDNITVLMAASAKLSDGLLVKWPDKTPKHFWVEDFDDIKEYLEWNVFVDKISEFHVDVLLSSKEGEQFELKVLNTNSVLPVAANGNGWDKIDAGLIRLEKGNNRLRLTKKSNRSSASIKSLELLEKKEHESYLKRVEKFKVDTDWLANSGYGLMLQFGAWTYPEKGEHRKSLDELASTFDMTAFVDLVKETGASYVVWSLTWWDYKMMMPVESVDRIIGNSKRTSSENFIGKLAQELKNNNIRFILYYHLGHASHLGGKTDWWQAQDWPEEFASTGTGQREVFFTNWMDVVSEIGESLGENLDGWFFDDGLVYYPAPFEKMGVAARNGNSGRLISYNPWVCARYTDFQDVSFGEGSHGEVKEGSAPAFGNGIFTSGPQKGLLQHAMFTMEGDWGVHSPNQKIETKITKEQAFKWYKSASERKVPLSFNIMMWEDGTVSQTSLEILKALKKEFRNK